ncbi:helix-turn-helix domain-containing protein [uncultured Pseudomonas sp.]|uniref:GlxA family transcriptional regulator n=1 Tax=uncultured Pseudomonas sp. TaxID=114707 RepID=UPI0025E8F481|nr:helix-turn-helix domain-containing protein [uncultured Pseudomonas sp.]
MPSSIKVAVVAFDQISPFHLSVPCLVLGENRVHQGPWFDVRVCAAEPGPLRSTAGFSVACDHDLQGLDWADIVIVPSWRTSGDAPPQALLDGLRQAHARGARVVGLCLGAYVLAEAGLLTGCSATTHWAWAADFERRFPDVQLDPNVLYVQSASVMTSAGVAAGIDCCLHIVREHYGHDAANQVARRLVVPPHREGNQAQFIEQPVPRRLADRRMAELLDWLRAHLHQSHPIDAVAERLALSRRTFTRQFKRLTGHSFGDWLRHERIALARQRLESSAHSIEQIADECGFGSSASLRQHFLQALQISPSAYRRLFRNGAPAPAA